MVTSAYINTLVKLLLVNYQSYLFQNPKADYFSSLEQSFAGMLLSSLSRHGVLTQNGSTPVMSGRSQSLSNSGKPNVINRVAPGASQALKQSELEELAEEISSRYGVDPSLVKSIIQVESGFNPNAVSPAGAVGLMQLMPETATSLGVKDPFNPVQNIDGGVRYLKQMLSRYQGNVQLALAAYNSGPGTVDRAGGIPDYPATKKYIQKVLQKSLDVTV